MEENLINLEYNVNQRIPQDGERVLCYGNFTYCCSEDMEKEKDWHEATFRLIISLYKLKSKIPKDPEESILEEYKIVECWECGEEFTDGRVIGVTKWKTKYKL